MFPLKFALALMILLQPSTRPTSAQPHPTRKVLFFSKSSNFEHAVIKRVDGKPSFVEKVLTETGLARDVARGLDLDWVLKLYQPLLWPDLVFYFSVSPVTSGKRVTATRLPNFYDAGQDVTHVEDPVESYQHFIARVIREYESLALIFNFITVDAEQSIGDQHRQIRELFLEGQRRPWSDWNIDAVADWLVRTGHE